MPEWSMPVVMLTSVAGQYTASVGETITLPVSLAQAWIAAGIAAAAVSDNGSEAAIVAAPERAVRPRVRGRR